MIGRDILSAGGTAADAAVAMYLALAVTLPSSASLGGGGVCLVHDNETSTTEALDFLAVEPARIPPTSTRPSAVPGNPRGVFALHARYGRLRWERLVAPAAQLAWFGFQVSRAFAHDIGKVEAALVADPEMRRIFGRPDGRSLVKEGEFLRQVDLAGVLGRIARNGPGEFYIGQLARQLVEATTQAGGSLEMKDLRAYTPVWRETVKVPSSTWTSHFAPPPAAAGVVAGAIWAILTDDDRYEDASAEERPHLFAETALRAFADRARWLAADGTAVTSAGEIVAADRLHGLMASYRPDRHIAAAELDPVPVNRPENSSATTLVVADRDGSAVACALTMNNLFGTGRAAPGTGIVLATVPGRGGRGPTSLGPMLVVNNRTNQLYIAVAASGGVTAATAMLQVAVRAVIDEQPLRDAIAAQRLHHGGAPDLVYHEPGYDEARLRQLIERGHRVVATPSLGLVNMIYCTEGIPAWPDSCAVSTDPRGFGLAAGANK